MAGQDAEETFGIYGRSFFTIILIFDRWRPPFHWRIVRPRAARWASSSSSFLREIPRLAALVGPSVGRRIGRLVSVHNLHVVDRRLVGRSEALVDH